jgi:tyrosinase
MNNSSGVLHVRREVRSLGPGDQTLAHYADAVAEMQSRPEDDETSWIYQASIHGTEVENPLPTWNQCTHNTWFFVSWHRIFVYYFEEIVRSVVKDLHGAEAAENWALPYWNYCRSGEFATLPEAFREETQQDGSPNPLFVQERDPLINAGGEIPEEATESKRALATPEFIGKAEFGGLPEEVKQFGKKSSRGVVEGTPHGTVHNGVGGEEGWMSNVLIAAKDPIFWLHHCNIDRLWVEWISQGGGRENPTEGAWLNQSFSFFDAHNNHVPKTCGEVVDTEALHYKYDAANGIPTGPAPAAEPPAPAPTPEPEGEAAVPAAADPPAEEPPIEPKIVGGSKKVTLEGEPAAIPVEIDDRAREEVREASKKSDPRNLYLNIEDIEGKVNPGVSYGIYVNLPQGAGEEDKAKHHVGNVSLFGIELAPEPLKDEPAHNVATSVELGSFLRALGGGEHFDEGEITVTFLPLLPKAPPGKEDEYQQLLDKRAAESPPVHIGRVSIGIDA